MKWNVLLGIVISVGFVLGILYQVDFTQLLTALQSVHLASLALAALLLLFTHLIRAWRWRYLLEPVKLVATLPLFSAVSIGFMANMLLPAHAGEVVRAYIIGRRAHVNTMASFGTIVVERVMDFVAILLVLVFVLSTVHFPTDMAAVARHLRIGGYIAALCGSAVIGGLWLLHARTAQTMRLLRLCLAFLPARWLDHLDAMLSTFAAGLQTLQKGHHLLPVLGLSLFLWLVVGLSNMLVLHAFDLHFPLYAIGLILVLQTFGAVVPSGPGFIGTYHATVIAALAIFSVPRELALSVALVMHAAFFFPFILVGLVFLWKESLSLHDLWTIKAQDQAPALQNRADTSA
jgi:glycosyltransferase 2 family protein